MAFKEAGIDIQWSGTGIDEIGVNAQTGDIIVRIDPRYFRPTEVDYLLGDASKAKRILGWEPEVNVQELVKMMVASDLENARRDKLLRDNRYEPRNLGHE